MIKFCDDCGAFFIGNRLRRNCPSCERKDDDGSPVVRATITIALAILLVAFANGCTPEGSCEVDGHAWQKWGHSYHTIERGRSTVTVKVYDLEKGVKMCRRCCRCGEYDAKWFGGEEL